MVMVAVNEEPSKVQRISSLRRLVPKGVGMFFLQLLLIYGAVVLLAYFFQDRLLYLPDKTSLDQVGHRAQGAVLKLWPENGRGYRGFTPSNSPSPARGIVVVFHGNAGSALDRDYYVQPLQRLGFGVILVEYPGYGGRAGDPCEAVLVADGQETVRMAAREYGVPIYVWGESLGCGVASAVAAALGPAVGGIILLTPWDSLPRTAQAHYWFLPARWLVRDQYDNIHNLRQFSGPVAVLMSDRDEVIPNRLT
ncbi:MAG TPA: hypothetical protein DEO88_06945, partial [Syntrophobacteraceae bacterium]|nr:hypothetical protein [Syntrophobacteraceae bacterium]